MRSALLALLLLAPASLAVAQDAPEDEGSTSSERGGDEGSSAGEEGSESPAEAEARLRSRAGVLALRRGDLEDALADFERAWALAPTPERGWALADAQSALGRREALRETYRSLLELAPDHARAAEARARLAVLEAAAVPEPPAEATPTEATELDDPADAADPDGADRSDEDASDEGASDEDDEWTILDEPWFWIVAAVVAVGGVAAALILTADPGTEDPIPGDDGFVVRTLVEWE